MSQPLSHAHALKRLVDVVQELSLARSLQAVMTIVAAVARELTGADGATFVLREGDKCHYADESAISPLWKGKRFPMSICISGWAMLNRRPAVIEDVFADPRIPAEAYRPTFVKSLVMVPIRTAAPVGAIGNYWAERQAPSPETVAILQNLADAASVAMENVRLYGALEERLKELEIQKEKADSASRMKSEFLASMSHEIRTPMNSVMGMIELALMQKLPTNAEDYLLLAKQSARHLLETLGSVLDLAKIESGKIELEETEFSPAEAIASALKPFHAQAAGKGLRLLYSIDKSLPERTTGDQGKLRQILNNLLSNAMKFTNAGEISVSASGHVLEGSAAGEKDVFRLLVSVKDSGIGIPKANLESIFESFSQVGTPTQVKYGGTGLGLAISRRLVEMMGGRIWAESEPGEGSEFHFSAMFELAKQDRRDEFAKADKAPPAVQSSTAASFAVLLVEDNALNRSMTKALLEKKGHRVTPVDGGRTALEALAKDSFDVVLMDIRMPGMDGNETSRIIRNAPPAGVDPTVPIIALTAYAFQESKAESFESGIDDYLAKPFDLDELDAVMRRVVMRRIGDAASNS